MSLTRVSMVIVGIYLSFSMVGVYKTIDFYRVLQKGLIEKQSFFNLGKSAITNVSDDFRKKKFSVSSVYGNFNIDTTLFASEGREILFEKEEGIAQMKRRYDEHTLSFSKKKNLWSERGVLLRLNGKAIQIERHYYYGDGTFYHKMKQCVLFKEGKKRIFSGMEEAALDGHFPCQKCMIGVRR